MIYSKVGNKILSADGEVIDWKKKYKHKRLDIIYLTNQLKEKDDRWKELEEQNLAQEKSIQKMKDSLEKSIESLNIFGNHAKNLVLLADYIVKRSH